MAAIALNLFLGVVVSRWAPQSSKLVAGCAEQAAVGSTPIHSRLHIPRLLDSLDEFVDGAEHGR